MSFNFDKGWMRALITRLYDTPSLWYSDTAFLVPVKSGCVTFDMIDPITKAKYSTEFHIFKQILQKEFKLVVHGIYSHKKKIITRRNIAKIYKVSCADKMESKALSEKTEERRAVKIGDENAVEETGHGGNEKAPAVLEILLTKPQPIA